MSIGAICGLLVLLSILGVLFRKTRIAAIVAFLVLLDVAMFTAWHGSENAGRPSGQRSRILMRCQEEVARHPDSPEAQRNLGQALAEIGRFDEAIVLYQKALVLNPEDAEAHCGLANVLLCVSRADEAAAEYSKALELNPDDAQARASLDVLVQARGVKWMERCAGRKVTKSTPKRPAPMATTGNIAVASLTAKIAASAATEKKKAAAAESTRATGEGGSENTRPAWVDAGPQLVDDVYQMRVPVGPYTTLQECEANLPEAIRQAVKEYADRDFPEVTGTSWLPDADFCRELIKDRWEEVKQFSVGPMTQLYVLLQFDRKAREQIADACQQGVVQRRVWFAGEGMAAVMGVLALLYGSLKLAAARAARKA